MLWWKIVKFLKAQVSFPSNVASIFSAMKNKSPIPFLAQTLHTLFKTRSPLKCRFLRFLSALVKLRQIPHVNFEQVSQFLFKLGIILHCCIIKLPCKFSAHAFSTLDKRIPSKYKFLDFQTRSGENLLNSSYHFWKHKLVFLQILHQYSVPSKINPLYFF